MIVDLTPLLGGGYTLRMARLPSFGLRARIVISLAVVMTLFTVLTELTVSQLVRVSLAQHRAQVDERSGDEGLAAGSAALDSDTEQELARLRRLVLFYLITGALVTLVVGSILVSRAVVRPLTRVTRAVERVAEGKLDTRVPIGGSGELIQLGVSFNRMTRTLLEQRESLRDKIEELERSSTDLRNAQDRLIRAAKLASVGTLAAGVAHEIGNPLAGVQGLLDAFDQEEDPRRAERYRELIRRELARIDRIIGELNDYARPPRRDSPARCELEPVIEHARSLLGAQKLFDSVEVVTDLGHGERTVAISRDDATQLLVNLMLNAAHAMEGVGRIEIVSRPLSGWRPPLGVVARDSVELTITDDGPGVPEEFADRIFDPFFSHRRGEQGSGLGLAICQSICERAGAEIWLDRDYDAGARFRVVFPQA
ncbi:MAG: ATP-binding protein [Polyangia bacterium]